MKAFIKWLGRRADRIEFYIIIAAVLITVCLLFIKPITGVANNGDYGRIMTPAGLEFTTGTMFTNLDQYFTITKSNFTFAPGESFISSHLLPVFAAKWLNMIIKSRNVFDIRFLGLIYSMIYLTGIFLIARGNKRCPRAINVICSALLVFILCDSGYISYFNSFLGEAAIAVFLILLFGIASVLTKKREIPIPMIICYYIAALLFISAKQANAPMGIFIAIFGLSILLVDRRLKVIAALSLSTVAIVMLTIFLYSSAPASLEMITKHQTVFYGILKDSPTPSEDLEFLGIDKKLAVLKEASYYDSDLPIASKSELLKNEFYSKISFAKVLKFYLYHPSRFIEKLEITAKNSTMIKPPYLGNFRFEDTGERLEFNHAFSIWSTAKKIYMPNNLISVIIFFAVFMLAIIFEYYRAFKVNRDLNKAFYIGMFLLLWIIGATQFVIPILGDGEVDLPKHMFLYNLCFDLMFISAVGWILNKLSVSFKRHAKATVILASSTVFLIVAILLTIGLNAQNPINSHSKDSYGGEKTSATVKIGDYLEFGRYGGTNIIWQVISKDTENVVVMADSIICFKAFDASGTAAAGTAAATSDTNAERQKFGSNNWESSTLRRWLNSDGQTVNYGAGTPDAQHVWKGSNSYDREPGFLYGFTAAEKNAVKTVKRKSILSILDKDERDGGSRYYFWTNCIPLLMQNYEDAYYKNVEDKVSLPDVRELKEYIFDNGLKCRRTATLTAILELGNKPGIVGYSDYWLRTPYTTRASFVRYVGSDGYVYHKDAYYSRMGVLPVLSLKPGDLIVKGVGTKDNAFRLAGS